MSDWKRIITRSLPFGAITYYTLIVASQVRDFDFQLRYVGQNDLIDSGIGWFPLLWMLGAVPFIFLALISKRYAHSSRLYWAVLLGAFAGLSALGFWLDHLAYYQIYEHAS